MRPTVTSGIRPGFPGLSQSQGQVTHVLLTRSPLEYPRKGLSARLACVKHAASVRPEPGSNSPLRSQTTTQETNPEPPNPGNNPSKTTNPPKPQRACASPQRNPGHPPPTKEGEQPGATRPKKPAGPIKALAFNTLLSSQETDTHRVRPTHASLTPGQPFNSIRFARLVKLSGVSALVSPLDMKRLCPTGLWRFPRDRPSQTSSWSLVGQVEH
jgi:hypothetical protein